MNTWNLRSCIPAWKVVHLLSVQTQLGYIPIVFHEQFNTRQRPSTPTPPSDEASPTRLTLFGNLAPGLDKEGEQFEKVMITYIAALPARRGLQAYFAINFFVGLHVFRARRMNLMEVS